MPATNDTPIKRFTAFWVVMGAFLLFGIIALILAPLTNTSEVTAADEAGAKRRLAVRELVDAEQVKNLSRVENGDKLQVAPAEIFSLVGAKLASTKPAAMKNEMFRDPASVEAEEPAKEVSSPESVDSAKVVPASDVKPAASSEATPATPKVTSAEPAKISEVKPVTPATVPETKPAKPTAAPKVAPAEATKAPVPAAKKSPALTPQAPRPESTSESAEPSAN